MKLGNDDMSILTRSSCTELLYLYASEILDFFSEFKDLRTYLLYEQYQI